MSAGGKRASPEMEKGVLAAGIGWNYELQKAINSLLALSLEELPLVEVLERALAVILAVPVFDLEAKGAVFLLDHGTGELVMRASHGLHESLRRACGRLALGRCLCGRAAETGELQFANAVDERHDIHYEGMVPHGHYCVPIRFRGEVIGVINLYVAAGHRRTAAEADFLVAIANGLAGVIKRFETEAERERLIAELRTVLEVLSRSQKEWQNTFDGITDMIAILDREGRIVKVNSAYARSWGLHPRELVGRLCAEYCLGGSAGESSCDLVTAALAGGAPSREVRDQRTGRLYRIAVFPCAEGEEVSERFVLVAEDITEEREREQLLVANERLAAVGQMASGIAHEINNPLASIGGCAEGLVARAEKGNVDPGVLKRYLGIIQEAVARCKKITTATLCFVRTPAFEKKAVDLGEILDNTLEVIGYQGRLERVEVIRRYDADARRAFASDGELRQVFLIVIANALDAMHDQGRIVAEIRAVPAGAQVRISDSGPGIGGGDLERVFTPFFSTRSDCGGTGLGLSIARRIITDHGGTIALASRAGEGATVEIVLPHPAATQEERGWA